MASKEIFLELHDVEKAIAKFPHFHVFDAKHLEISEVGKIAEYLANRFSDPTQKNVFFVFSSASEMALFNMDPLPYLIIDGGRGFETEYLYIMVNKEYKNEISYLKVRFM